MAKQRLWLPPSISKTYGFKRVEEETFKVGPDQTPVYIPGASSLDKSELAEILHWQEERAQQESKKNAERQKEAAKVTTDEIAEMRDALQVRAQWEDKRAIDRGDLPAS